MAFRIGWFSTGRDEAARDLLEVVASHIEKGTIPGKVSLVFSNRENRWRDKNYSHHGAMV